MGQQEITIAIMKKHLVLMLSLVLGGLNCGWAKEDAPSGFTPLVRFADVKEKAAADKKLVVLLVKGMDDNCPHCAAAMEAGSKALGGGVLKLFARAETIGNLDATSFSPTMNERIKKGFVRGAAVTFVVFDPQAGRIIAEAGRNELDGNKKATAEFKKQITEAKKAAK